MAIAGDVKLGQLTKYLFTAPSWPVSLLILILLGLIIDGAGARAWVYLPFSGTLAFTIPAIAGFLFTKPIIEYSGKTMTWNRSALLALACTVFAVIITFASLAGGIRYLPLFYGISLGFVFGLRLFVLVAISDDPAGRYPERCGCHCRVFPLLAGMGGLCCRSPCRLRPRLCDPHLAHRAPALPCVPYPGARVCQCIYRQHD